MVPPHLLVGQRAPRHRPIERKDIGVHDRGVQMPDHNGQRRQDRFIEMDRPEQVERPILHLLPVGEAPLPRVYPCQAEMVLEGPQQLAPIRDAGRADAPAGPPQLQNHIRTPATKARWDRSPPSRTTSLCVAPILSFHVTPMYGANSLRIS